MATNQGLLQAQIKVKNTIDLNNAFSSPSVANPQLKSIEGDLNLSNEYALQSFNSSNTNTQHIDTIRTNSSNTSLKEALNNLPNLKYVRLEGNYESKGNSFDNNTNLQKVDLSESLQVKPEDFKANESLKTLPKLDYSNPDLTDIITNDTNLKPTTFDISNEPNTNKLGIHGDSTHQLGNLEFVKVNPDAPFDNQITSQINVSYTSLDRNGLINLFNTIPYNVGYEVVGSPTIIDDVASGFTRNDSLRTSQSFTDSGQDFSMQFSINNFTQATDVNPIVSNYESSIGGNYFAIVINSPSASYPNRFSARIKGSAIAVQSTHTIDYTKSYRLLFQRVSGVYTLKVYQDGTLVDTQQLVSSELLAGGAAFTFNIGANNYYFTVGFSGSIDLNETYIKINSQISTGPIGYTVVGSPTITGGVVSNVNSSNCLKINGVYNSGTSAFEIQLDYTTASVAGKYARVLNLPGISIWNPGGQRATTITITPVSGSTITLSALYNVSTEYLVKLVYDGTSYYFYVNGTLISTTEGAAPDFSTSAWYNYYIAYADPFEGTSLSVNLNNTYIKVNDVPWFGHESKQVTWFNSKPSQIKVVDVSGATGTSSLTNDDKAIVTNKSWKLITNGSNSKNYIIEDGKLVWANPNIYLEGATGIREAYLKSGVIPTNNTTFEIKCKNNEQTQNTYPWFFDGGAANSSTNALGMAYGRNNSILNVFAASTYFSFQNTSSSDIYNVKTSISGSDYIVDLNGTSITKTNTTFTDTPAEIIIFGIGLSTGPYIGETSENYIYYLKFFENNVLIRHFVPVPTGLKIGNFTVPSNGMFDIVNQQFYANQGTGKFTYGWDLE